MLAIFSSTVVFGFLNRNLVYLEASEHLTLPVCKAKNAKRGASEQSLWPNHMFTFVLKVYNICFQSRHFGNDKGPKVG